MRYRAELLIVLCCAACGGHSVGTEPAPPTRPDPSGTSAGTGAGTGPSPGMPSQGGATSQLDPPPTCSGPEPVCVPDCTSLNRTSSACDGLQFRCPDGRVDLDSCPTDACARRSRSCCSPTGHPEVPTCAADGTIGDCPEGFAQKSTCVPEGLGIEGCLELSDGQACSNDAMVCLTDRCGWNCYCDPDAMGVLRWQCWVNLC